MLVLDCETRSSALATVSAAYGLTPSTVSTFCLRFDLDHHYKKNSPQQTGDRELRRIFEETFNVSPSKLDRVIWFHLTRTSPDVTFEDGIRPLDEEIAWCTLLNTLKGTLHGSKLLAMRRKKNVGSMYSHKMGVPHLSGPYAMLVKEVAWRSDEMGNHDYLGIPEIVDDICNEYAQRYGASIHDLMTRQWRATIVRFWSEAHIGDDCTEAALFYLYRTLRGERLSYLANTCFDGQNCAVQPGQIERIERFTLKQERAMRSQYILPQPEVNMGIMNKYIRHEAADL